MSSGKGGVGKTCTSVNLAILLAQQGYKVCLFDADANLANVNIMLKLIPEYTLHHVISGEKTLDDITLNKAGIQIIPGASGLTDFVSLPAKQQQRLLAAMRDLKTKYDYLLIDNPAGIHENVLSFINYSDHGIIIISPEPTSLTDAFALIRVLQKRGNKKLLNIIVNNAPSEAYANKIFKRFLVAVKTHIGSHLNYLGCILTDEKIATSVCLQNPVVLRFPTAPSVRNYNELSVKLTALQKQELLKQPEATKDKTVQPDFSTTAAALNKDREQPVTESVSNEKLVTEFINQIKNEKIERATVKEMLLEMNNAYLKHFGDYVVDIPQLLQDAMKMDRISQSTMKNMIKTLLGLYQDQYGVAFEPQTTSVTSELKQKNLKQETAELLIKLLQKEMPSEPEQAMQNDKINLSNIEQTGPKLVPPVSPTQNPNQDLIDSIRYAAMIDK